MPIYTSYKITSNKREMDNEFQVYVRTQMVKACLIQMQRGKARYKNKLEEWASSFEVKCLVLDMSFHAFERWTISK